MEDAKEHFALEPLLDEVRYTSDAAEKYPKNKHVHQMFEEQVGCMPREVAVLHDLRSITYVELNSKANQLARYLKSCGVGPDQVVGICIERSLEMVIALVGILKAGGAYLPLDPNYPAERLHQMLDDAAPRVVLTKEALKAVLPPSTESRIVALDEIWNQLTGLEGADLSIPDGERSGSNLLYVIYTSGSTGRPKGTAMSHRSMLNLMEWHRESFMAGARVLQFAALSFDVAFQEIFSTLCTGGTLVMLDERIRNDPQALLSLLDRQIINRLFMPPLMLQSLAESFRTNGIVPKGLTDVITAGEQLRITPEIVAFFRSLRSCRLHNHYGPTETHVVTALTLSGNPKFWPPMPCIGAPIRNTSIHILDAQLQPVRDGAAGELYIAGLNVAQGYLRRPDLTSERFVADPSSRYPGSRMYKSGDLGRRHADGTIEYFGRNDEQVKIRGYRIELGEIEAQLLRHAQVREAAVVAREDALGDRRLVAYVTAREKRTPSANDLRRHMQSLLPEHMVPSAFVILDTFPITPSGKLDRRSLPAPSVQAFRTGAFVSPQGEKEQILSRIWVDLLGMVEVGRHDNFFELGGHSLSIVRMMTRLRQLGISADPKDLFERPRLSDFALALKDRLAHQFEVPPNLIPADCRAITPEMLPLVRLEPAHIELIEQSVPGAGSNIQDIYPLAPLQEGLLFHHKLDDRGGDTYVLPMLLSLSSRQRLEDFLAALQKVVDRHDILRTAVLWDQLPQPVQVVYRRVALPVKELVLGPGQDAIEQLKELMKPDRQRIDLREAPPLRVQVAPDASSPQWYALLQLHHFAGDHESVEEMFAEVSAYLEDRDVLLPTPVPFRDHVAEAVGLQHERTREAETFFKGKLGDIDQPTAPFGLLDVYGDGSRIEDAHRRMESSLARRMRACAKHMGVSAATLFHAAFGLVVARAARRDDVVYGTVLLGRLQGSVPTERTLGMFINSLPLRLRIGGSTVRELVEQTHRELIELLNHEQASLVLAQSCSGVSGSIPLFSSLLNYRHIKLPIETGQPVLDAGVQLLMSEEWTNYPIVLSVDDQGEDFVLTAHTDYRVDPNQLIGYTLTAMEALIEALDVAPSTPALDLPVMTHAERRFVIETLNATKADYPQRSVVELFQEQVKRTPTGIAVVCGEEALTFAELNDRANRLACYLQANSVAEGGLVAICVGRNLLMIVGIMGILKAGGAYVPLDPDYPTERLAYMLQDAGPSVVLTEAKFLQRLPSDKAKVIPLDGRWGDDADDGSHTSRGNATRIDEINLAYVIYTSGSTGAPKGVMISHLNVAGLWQGLDQIYRHVSGCQRIALNASFTFDASVKQIIQLLSGRTLVLVPAEVRIDAPALLDFLERNRIDGIDCTPSQLKTWISAGLIENERYHPKIVLVGGEPIESELWASLARCTEIRFYNVYGPTESTVDTTWAALKHDASKPHIGSPMENRRVYILDERMEAVPIGVSGEIYIGGDGVARGYLGRPGLTAERFLADPFNAEPYARMYRSGDLGRWRRDGRIEYLGRNDDQVKIRGFRIELGDIATKLLQNSQVKDVAVVARQDLLGEMRLVAYIVPNTPNADESGAVGNEVVGQWMRVHDETYSAGAAEPNFVGWNSSYTGQPIPEREMDEWLAGTVERIVALKPERVLEIGCGVGLLLQHIAPLCKTYVGTDFSLTAISQLRQWLSGREDLKHVTLLHRAATELQELQPASFDTIVLNSVIQYFPNIEYLLAVLRDAARLLCPGGRIFVGDVRHLGLISIFHSAVQLSKAAANVSVGQLRRRIARAVAQEKELLIDPRFFNALPGGLPGISAVSVQLKRGQAHNELTRYRYDVVLHIGDQIIFPALCERVDWGNSVGSMEVFEAALRKRSWSAVVLHGIVNTRLVRDVAAVRMIETGEDQVAASSVRRQLETHMANGVDPEAVWKLAEGYGYDLEVNWDTEDPPECFAVSLKDRTRLDKVSVRVATTSGSTKGWDAYANDPRESNVKQQLIPELREYLASRVPDYMIPSIWMMLKQLPLTPNGKVDRRALPAPQGRPEELGEYVAPQTELERTLTDIWAQVLQIDQVGVQDNFFEIGGHSILAMQVIVRVRSELSIDVPMRLLFEYPTIEQLSIPVEQIRQARLIGDLEAGGEELEELMNSVAGMADSEVQELMRELRNEVRS